MKKLFFLALLCPFLSNCQPLTLKGKIINEQMEPIAGATITLKRSVSNQPSSVITQLSSDAKGEFTMTNLLLTDTLIISAVGYETATKIFDFNFRGHITIILKRRTSVLDEAVVIAYGTTTRRLNTGSVSRLTSEEISRQPVQNPLLALEGRVPGLAVVPTSGMPGSAVRVQVRGRNSLSQGSDPLFIIDGVPYAPNNNLVNQYYSAAGGFPDLTTGLSPFAAISPSDIQSIEVLKDADATAIYGSRGANGVILITTKKGAPGKTKFTASLSRGISSSTRVMPLHNTADYINMRRQAFFNDNTTPIAANAPDLLVWDTARYTNLQKVMLAGAAPSTSAQASVSGGQGGTQFLLSASYNREGTVVPGNQRASRGAAHLNLSHGSGRLSVVSSLTYSSSHTNLALSDLSAYTSLPPNYPSFYTADGNLAWQQGGLPITNPFAYLLQKYNSVSDNLLANLELTLSLAKGLLARVNGGYNTYTISETTAAPKISINPYTATNPSGSSQAGNNAFKSWIVEPQLHYSRSFGKLSLSAIGGASLQQTANHTSSVSATGYTSDGLIYSFNAAASLTATNNDNRYRYNAAFGRLSLNWQNHYMLNLSGRRDGSSRFGPGSQFASFGAAGLAWQLHTHKWFTKAVPLISFAKLRASYGTTGNDQVGNYQYLDTWSGSNRPYNGFPSLLPTRLFNPDYAWELNRKWNGALELGFLQDRILLAADYFLNRSSNQLIRYNLPAQTGFTTVLRNFPATVQNTGWEFTLTTKNLPGSKWEWGTTANLTIHRNKLLSFAGIESSPYANSYIVGQSVNLRKGYHFLGVNPQTGVYEFDDTNKDGQVNTNDYVRIATGDPDFYGGIGNSLVHGNWSLDVFFEFKKQQGRSWEAFMPVPGTASNLPVQFSGWWQQPGDQARYQKLTASPGTDAYKAIAKYTESDAVYSDASYIRCKTVYLAYALPQQLLSRVRLSAARLFVQAQNLFVITGYNGPDPEIQNPNILQPLRTVTAGLSLTF